MFGFSFLKDSWSEEDHLIEEMAHWWIIDDLEQVLARWKLSLRGTLDLGKWSSEGQKVSWQCQASEPGSLRADD